VNQESETRSDVKVLIVDDSAFMRTALSRMIASEPGLVVAGTAWNGSEALEKIDSLDPDVVTLDLEMPGLDGLETLRRIMSQSPRPVIVVSSISVRNAEITSHALGAGAFDCVPKQLSPTSLDIVHIRQDLVAKIKAAARSAPCHLRNHRSRRLPRSASLLDRETFPTTPAIVAIGTSTGGPKALQEILPALPRDLSVPILIVQHMPPGLTAAFAQRLNALCSLNVREATHHEVILPGIVYIAPAGLHMIVERSSNSPGFICLTPQPEDCLHTPSVDVLLKSVASVYRSQAMGVILTGMGSDGAAGMKSIHRQGGLTVGQDEATCTVYGMPRACAELGILHHVVPLAQISQQILQATRYRKHAHA
jgi:two-component system chemotaxis response regulator CheB